MNRQRKEEIINKRRVNEEEEQAFLNLKKEHNSGKNPWEKVIANVEIKEGNYQGNRDVGRMRQCMNARRNDVKQGIINFS